MTGSTNRKHPTNPTTRALHVVLFAGAALAAALTATGCGTGGPPALRPGRAQAETQDRIARFQQMDRVTVQIVRGTSHLSDAEYRSTRRPRLPAQLARLGFTSQESEQILARVDDARADRQRVQRWWASLTGSGETAHARR